MGQTQNAQAQLGYPNKPIRLVVPYGAGGVGDQTMRLLANALSQQIKQPIVIENRPGAGGSDDRPQLKEPNKPMKPLLPPITGGNPAPA